MRAHRQNRRPLRHTRTSRVGLPRLRPVALAVLAGLAAQVGLPAGAADLRVPVPAVDWLVSGRGFQATINAEAERAAGRLVVNQQTNRAIYNWTSFDIGRDASATFNMPSSTSSALNRVVGTTLKPSEILGKLTSNGQVYIINRNGIIFGTTAQVNVGGLIASTLEVGDDDYVAGFTSSIVGSSPTFAWKDVTALDSDGKTTLTLATYDHPDNYVKVEQGAQISTSSGGRVFLVAKNVINDGTLSSPDGQVVLAAGEKVYLADPSNELLYAIESNTKIPATRGLLVEVGGQNGEATNGSTGVINTARGNTTIVGMAVNQNGRISATTSVSANGTVFLQARGNVSTGLGTNNEGKDVTTKRAQTGGVLTLGQGSRIDIGVDSALNADGSVPMADGNTTFKASRVLLSGQTIELKDDARITAPGATVQIEALDKPRYADFNAASGTHPITGQTALTTGETGRAKVILGKNTKIDVSGTTAEQVSVARHFVTTKLLGADDLKDAPLQKEGPIYRSQLTLDLREGSNILSADTMSSLRNSVQRSAQELMSSGGSVTIASSGTVATHQTSSIDVSGGQVTYTAAKVNPSVLVAANGARYTLNKAPKDIRYVAIEGNVSGSGRVGASGGVVSDAQQGRIEAGYVEGKDAGSITIVAPTAVLDGAVRGATVVGQRQALGLDALAKTGRLQIGTRSSGMSGSGLADDGKFGTANFLSAVAGNLIITATKNATDQDAWLQAGSGSRISAATLNESGMGVLEFTSDGGITLEDGAHLQLGAGSTVSWAARGSAGITLGGDIRSSGGTVSMETNEKAADRQTYADNGTGFGTITLKAGRQIDVSGNWVNQVADGKASAAALKGGSVTLKSAHGLQLESGSGINVSGGATLLRSGVVKSSDAGSIQLSANGAYSELVTASSALDPVVLQANLQGYSMAQGGKLGLSIGADVNIHAPNGRPAIDVTDGATLSLSTDFFNRGGFSSFSVGAFDRLNVMSGAQLAPQTVSWRSTSLARATASGSSAAVVMAQTVLPAAQRSATSLALTATGTKAALRYDGDLHVEQGGSIDVGPKGSVVLKGGTRLVVDGAVKASGGSVAMSLEKNNGDPHNPFEGEFRLGSTSIIDVSGSALIKPSTSGLLQGEVLDGGKIALSFGSSNAHLTTLEVQQGAVLNADGGLGELDISTLGGVFGATTVRQQVASQGGTISIDVNTGGAVLAGDMHARAANASALGGTLTLSTQGGAGAVENGVHVQQGALTAAQQDPAQVAAGAVTVSAARLSQDFASVSLTSNERIHFDGDVSLALRNQLNMDAPIVSADAGATVNASGASVARMGFSQTQSSTASAAQGGSATLNLNGGLVELYGKQSLQGVGAFNATADSALRLAHSGTGVAAGLYADADITLKAPQVYLNTATDYTVNAAGRTVTFTGGQRAAPVPLSAGSALTVNAARIVQEGVLRAPFGRITLNASERIDIKSGSITSVSGNGLTVPYGTTSSGGADWTYDGTNDLSLPDKDITFNAPSKSVNVDSGAVLDLSGGGNVVAYEFTPGPGGSTDVFTGSDGAFAIVPGVGAYAPQDLQISSGASSAQQITFGEGGLIPAGTYAILPARYALLPGAFLVKAVSGSSSTVVQLGNVVGRADGSQVMAGVKGYAGVSGLAANPSNYLVMTSAQAKRYSDIRITSADTFLAEQAAANSTAVARRPVDAGSFTLNAGSAKLNGQVLFNVPSGGRGGEFNVSADRIRVSDKADDSSSALVLSAAQIKSVGASSVLLGGKRSLDASGATDRVVEVTAQEVVVDGGSAALTGNDLVLAATKSVTINDGASISASTSTPETAQSLAFKGDGALLRVSGDASARTVRTGSTGSSGALSVGDKVALSGGSITAEATGSTSIASSVVINTSSLTLGAGRVAVGEVGKSASSGTLVLSPTLLNQMSQAANVTLRSFSGIDFYGSSRLGGDRLASLTLDTAQINLMGDRSSAALQAGGVTLTNTTGASAGAPSQGTGSLSIAATGAVGGSGHITLGSGSVAAAGVSATSMSAAGSVVFAKGSSSFASAGDTTITASSLTAQTGAQASMASSGGWVLNSPAAGTTTTASSAGVGAHVAITAGTIKQAGTVALTSGELKLTSTSTGLGDTGSQGVRFASGSLTDLSGQSKTYDGVNVSTAGGSLVVQARAGDIAIDRGATINVSAPSAGGSAGSVTLQATQGAVSIDGRLVGTAAAGQTSGRLNIDSQQAIDLAGLAATLAAEQTGVLNNFRESLMLRNRSGDQVVASGTTLSAKAIEIDVDAGGLTVAGTLNANGTQGGTITLASAGKLTLQSGGVLSANATGTDQDGGQINLMSSNAAINGVSSGGIALQSGGLISTQANGSGEAGELNVRSARTADGKEVLVSAIESTLSGVGRVEVEAVKVYNATSITGQLINSIYTDNATLAGSGGVNEAAVRARLAAGQSVVSDVLKLRAGVEVQSTGDLTLVNTFKSADNKKTLTGWSLELDGNGNSAALVGGQPMNLTLRAAGHVKILGSISSGFASTSPSALITGEGASVRLVGGADVSAANVMSTVASETQGDVIIGAGTTAKPLDVMVRSTTGDVQIAAGRDVELLNRSAVVYTTGVPVDGSTLSGYTKASANDAYLAQSAFLVGGGDVSVTAQRDVKQSATTTPQAAADWLWRQKGSGASTAWYSRYDYFKQGFGSFGGGSARVHAGRDATRVEVVAPASGYFSAGNATLHAFGGGDVSLVAGRDVNGGYALTVGDNNLLVQAGRDIALGSSSQDSGLQALYGNANTVIAARNNATVGVMSTFGLTKQAKQGSRSAVGGNYISGLVPDANLLLQADAGDVDYKAKYSAPASSYKSTQQMVVADTTFVAAPNGSVALGEILQAPTGEAHLNVLAENHIDANKITVLGSGIEWNLPTNFTASSIGYMLADDPDGQLTPVRLVASKGSVKVNSAVVVAKPLRVMAGQDIVANNASGFSSQHHSSTDLTLLQAARDVVLGKSVGTGVDVHGPGALVVAAGRNVNLGISSGILAKGNRENARLPDRSADINVLAGIDLAHGAYDSALLADSDFAKIVLADAGYSSALMAFIAERSGHAAADSAAAWKSLQALSKEEQQMFVHQVLFSEIRAAGRKAAALGGDKRDAAYAQAYEVIAAVFPAGAGASSGSIDMGASAIKTNQGSAIVALAPYGGLNVGRITGNSGASSASLGMVTSSGGSISVMARDDVTVNQSRVFTVGKGDLLMWSSQGNIDAGKGAKTVASAPAPIYRLDPDGNIQVDTTGSFSGSGIAVLSKSSSLDLYAPQGEINAGDAGIQSEGNAFFGAQRLVGADNIGVGGVAMGAPAAPKVDAIAVSAPRLNTDGPRSGNESDQEQIKKKRKRNLQLDFLGAGEDSQPAQP